MYILSHSNSELNLILDSLLMAKLRLNYRHYRKSLEKEEKTPDHHILLLWQLSPL